MIRDQARTLLPTTRATRRAAEIARAHGCDRVWFGAAAPLAAMTPGLLRQADGIRRTVATTHGHEIWWARTPGARRLLRRIGRSVDVVTYLGEYTRARITPALGPDARLARLVPGVDPDRFRPAEDGARRARSGPVILCVARLVPRKGQDVLIRVLPAIRRAVPGATLVLVGQGPDEDRLRALAHRCTEPGTVEFTGGLDHAATAAHYAAADVFAMPCRTRRAGLEAEGLGIVYLEAAAAGLPVVAGRSGGAPTPSSTASPAPSSTAATPPAWPPPSPASSSPRRPTAPAWAPPAATGPPPTGPGTPPPTVSPTSSTPPTQFPPTRFPPAPFPPAPFPTPSPSPPDTPRCCQPGFTRGEFEPEVHPPPARGRPLLRGVKAMGRAAKRRCRPADRVRPPGAPPAHEIPNAQGAQPFFII
ncbi:hypothetical protein P3T27_007744 [Kitasatospora sp. MAA19]|nr:hypothetical protein [Kitasatospora sp. MAA19]